MKTIKTIIALSLFFTGITLTSCHDKKEPETPAAKAVAGSYKGDMTCAPIMGIEVDPFTDITFVATATDDATVDVVVPAFSYNGSMEIPSIKIEGIKVSGTDGEYQLAMTDFEGTSSTDRAYKGTTSGNVTNNKLTLNIELYYGSMPMPMNLEFIGTK